MTDRTAVRKQRVKRALRRASIATVVAIVAGLAISWFVAGRLVAPDPYSIGAPPADFDAEVVQIPSKSGSMLAGWYVSQPEPKGAVLLLHGIRANRLQMLDRARLLVEEGYSVLLIDFQAHGESPGEQITVGYEERHDVLAATPCSRWGSRSSSLPSLRFLSFWAWLWARPFGESAKSAWQQKEPGSCEEPCQTDRRCEPNYEPALC